MSLTKLKDLLDLIEDLATKSTALKTGPLRVQVPFDVITADQGLPHELDAFLDAATVLALRVDRRPSADDLAHVEREVRKRADLLLDLHLPEILDPSLFPETLGPRCARLRFSIEANALDEDASARVGQFSARIAGRVELSLLVDTAATDRLHGIVTRGASWDGKVSVRLQPVDLAAREALHASFGVLARAARQARLNLWTSGGKEVREGRPLDVLVLWNVLEEGYRSAFRPHPELCPFPFSMLRWESGGRHGLCPKEDGPMTTVSSDCSPWNGQGAQDARRLFFARQRPSECRSCLLLPRVLASLAGSEASLAELTAFQV